MSSLSTPTSAPPTTRTTISTWSAPSTSPNVIAQVGYVGSTARHLLSLLDINQAKPGIYTTPNGNTNPPQTADYKRQITRPYYSLYPQYGNINQVESIGTSNYNSLQVTPAPPTTGTTSPVRPLTPGRIIWTGQCLPWRLSHQNNLNFKGDYSNSDFDTREHVCQLRLSRSSQLRRCTASHRWSNWQVNALLSFHGGQPFTVPRLHRRHPAAPTKSNDRAVQIAKAKTGYKVVRGPGVQLD